MMGAEQKIELQIEELKNQRNNLATNIASANVAASQTEKYNTLVPKVLTVAELAGNYEEQLALAKQSLVDQLTAKGIEASVEEPISELINKIADIEGIYEPRIIALENSDATDLDYELEHLSIVNLTDLTYMFGGNQNVTQLDLIADWDTSNITDMQYMLYNCQSLERIDLSKWNVEKVTNFNGMFFNTGLVDQVIDIPYWRTNSLVSCESMFHGTKAAQIYVDTWNFSNADQNALTCMFEECTNLVTVSMRDCDLTNIHSMTQMFSGDYNLYTLDFTNTIGPNVSTWSNTFNMCRALTRLDLSGFSCADGTLYARNMFYDCISLEFLDVRNFSFSTASTTTNMLYNVPTTCVIIVRDDTEKAWFNTNYASYTNVMTVREYNTVETDYPYTLYVHDDGYNLQFMNTNGAEMDGGFVTETYFPGCKIIPRWENTYYLSVNKHNMDGSDAGIYYGAIPTVGEEILLEPGYLYSVAILRGILAEGLPAFTEEEIAEAEIKFSFMRI